MSAPLADIFSKDPRRYSRAIGQANLDILLLALRLGGHSRQRTLLLKARIDRLERAELAALKSARQ